MHNLDLHIESLERRRMMAGNVKVRVTGGDLRIDGDARANEVLVRPTSTADTFTIEGLNGTTINGQVQVTATNVTDDFRINLRGGDDTFGLVETDLNGNGQAVVVPDDLTVLSGGGADVLLINASRVGDDVRVRSGAGEDTISVNINQTGDRLQIDSGGSGDLVSLGLLDEATSAQVRSGSGDDLVTLGGIDWDDPIELVLGGGDDTVICFTSDFDAGIVVKGGGGGDSYFDATAPFDSSYGGASGPAAQSVEERLTMSGSSLLTELGMRSNEVESFARLTELVLSL